MPWGRGSWVTDTLCSTPLLPTEVPCELKCLGSSLLLHLPETSLSCRALPWSFLWEPSDPHSLPGLLVWSICHSTATFLSIVSGWYLFPPHLSLCQSQASAHPGPQFPFSPVGTMERLSPIPILKSVHVKAGNSRGKCMQMNMQMSIFRIYERPRFQGEGTASARLGPLNPGPCQCRKAP